MAGLAAVATRVGQCPEVLDEGDAGILVPPGDPAALAERPARPAARPGAACGPRARLRERVRTRYSAAAVMEQVERVYHTVLSGRWTDADGSSTLRTPKPAHAVGRLARGEWGDRSSSLFLATCRWRSVLEPVRLAAGYHALATLGLGVWWATVGKRLDLALCAACYMAGAEVLWRMTGTGLFWEFGKYGVSLILLLVLVRLPGRRSTAWRAVLYFVLLLPSALLTLRQLGLAEARDAVSFNLSGPFSLAVAVLFFSSIRASAIDLRLRGLLRCSPRSSGCWRSARTAP